MTDALASSLPQHTDADRPWLVWYAPEERVELTGHVLAMWQSKTAGLIMAESRPGSVVHLGLPAHWRTVTWCAGAWLAGSPVLVADAAEVDALVGRGEEPAALSVAMDPGALSEEAEAQVLVPQASLAVRWPGELPPLTLDGLADLMPYPDHSVGRETDGATTAVLETDGTGALRRISRDELVQSLPDAQAGPGGRSVLVHEAEPLTAVRAVLAAWRAGLTAVLAAPEADGALLAAAARQEGAPL